MRVTKTCPKCGKVHEVIASRAKSKGYCSKQCANSHWEGRTYKPRVNGFRITKICVGCGKSFEVPPSADWRKYCSSECYFSLTPEERFFSMVNKRDDGHWEWTGYRNKTGYGLFRVNSGKPAIMAHRYSYELVNGPIPKGLFALHKRKICVGCHWCVNPDHLYPGTQKENAEDRAADGRDNQCKGSGNANSKLSDVDVKWIRQWAAHGYSLEHIAVAFNISFNATYMCVSRKSYKSVE